VLRITGEFAITNAVNDAGENVSVVDTESYNYQTKNASALIEQLKQIEDFRETVENATDDPTGGGFAINIPGLGNVGAPGLGLIALLGAALLLLRD
jgi:VCBS repeat-containing protein